MYYCRYHVAVTYSKRHAGRTGTGSSSLYINGKWVQALGYSIEPMATNDVILGASRIGENFVGVMDEVRLYRRALPPKEVSHHSAGRLSGNESGLLAYYRFDEGFGKVTADHRAMAKNGIRHDADLNGFFPENIDDIFSKVEFYPDYISLHCISKTAMRVHNHP